MKEQKVPSTFAESTFAESSTGNRETGITPEFSRVLKTLIFMNDRRWLVVIPRPDRSGPATSAGASVPLEIVVAAEPMPFPIDFEGEAQSPLEITLWNNCPQLFIRSQAEQLRQLFHNVANPPK